MLSFLLLINQISPYLWFMGNSEPSKPTATDELERP